MTGPRPSSPGLTCAGAGSGSGAWAGRATPTCASCRRSAPSRSSSTTGRPGRWAGRRPPGARHRRRRPGRAAALRRGGEDARASAGTGPRWHSLTRRASRWSAAWACGSQEADLRARPVHHRHQGQEHHHLARRAPADRARLPVPGRREHRRRALRPGQRGRLRLLGHRGVQLPGHRPARSRRRWSRSPRCTRTTWTGTAAWSSTTGTSCRRAPSPAPNSPWRTATATCSASTPRCSARGSSGSASTTTRRRTGWDRSACSARTTGATRSSPARCLVALGVPGAADDAALRAAAAGYRPLPSRLQPGRHGRRRQLRRRQPVHQRAAHAGRAGRLPRPPRRADRRRPRPRHRLRPAGGRGRGPRSAHLVLTLPDSGPRIQAAIEADGPRQGGGDRLRGPGRSRRARATAGPGPTASCCCPRPRRASARSGTTATAPRPSPAPCAPARADVERGYLQPSVRQPAALQPAALQPPALQPQSSAQPSALSPQPRVEEVTTGRPWPR